MLTNALFAKILKPHMCVCRINLDSLRGGCLNAALMIFKWNADGNLLDHTLV